MRPGGRFVVTMTRGAALAGLLLSLLAAPAPALAQGTGIRYDPDIYGGRESRRLIHRFIEDAVIAPGGWVEAQYRYANLANGGSRHFAGPLLAFRLGANMEGGLRFGFLDVNRAAGPGGSGLSDIDLYAKYRVPSGPRHSFAFGGLVKAPTADETEGLGTGEPDLELFSAFRADLEGVLFVLSAGVRFNGDAALPRGSSKDSYMLGGGLLMPVTPRLTIIVEGTYDSWTAEAADDDSRLTVGVQRFGRLGRGGFRAGIGVPLNDGAPDYEVLLGAYMTY